MRIIEVCCGNLRDAMEAQAGGAKRIELCSALEVGGLTPSFGLIRAVKEFCKGVEINVIIRPRPGDFAYSGDEITQMIYDITQCRRAGVHGVVIGALTPEGDVNVQVTTLLHHYATFTEPSLPHKLSVTFHRAFDVCRDPAAAIEDIVTIGCHRILTSGQRENALAGAENIAQYVKQAAGRIIIMPGCGVNPTNIAEIERVTGATEFHSTARGEACVTEVYANPHIDFGENRPQPATSREVVARLVN